MTLFLRLAFLCILLALAAIRLAPSDPARWHVDPRLGRSGDGRFVVRPDGGDVDGIVHDMTPGALLKRFDEIALSTPRTRHLAGSISEGRITYITRSRGLGFPDYTTVEAVPDGAGARLVVFARLRFGGNDFGVNRARVTGWLAALQA